MNILWVIVMLCTGVSDLRAHIYQNCIVLRLISVLDFHHVIFCSFYWQITFLSWFPLCQLMLFMWLCLLVSLLDWYLHSILICLLSLLSSFLAGTTAAAAPTTATDSAGEPCTSTCSRTICASDATTAYTSPSSSRSTKTPSSSGPSWCSASLPATATSSWSRRYQWSSGHRSHASWPTPSVSERRTPTTTTWGDTHWGGDPADAGPAQEALGWGIWTTAELASTKVPSHANRSIPVWLWCLTEERGCWIGWTEFGFLGTRSPMYELEPVWSSFHGSNCE